MEYEVRAVPLSTEDLHYIYNFAKEMRSLGELFREAPFGEGELQNQVADNFCFVGNSIDDWVTTKWQNGLEMQGLYNKFPDFLEYVRDVFEERNNNA
jgi:hypothetical protein